MNNRIPRIIKNSIIGILAAIVSTISTYFIRIVISKCLGDEIYGVNSIFISIVSAILILELGMSTAMIIVLYQPVADNNYAKIKSIINFFKKFYRYFCSLIFIIGIIVDIFFIVFFVNTEIDMSIVRLYFLLYLLSVVFKYLFSYKCCLLYANKQNSIISIITILNTIVFTSLEAVTIFVFKNYWLYLILYSLQNLFLNIFVNYYVNRKYPFITQKDVEPMPKEDKKKLIGIIKPMFIQRIASQIQDSSSIIIYGAIGATAISVGYLSNYLVLVHACQTLFNQIGAAFTTSFGNYSAKVQNDEEKYNYYKTSRFYMSWISIVFSCLYLCLIQTFIALFFGKEYCLSNMVAILFAIYVFIVLSSSINLSTQNAVGEHKLDAFYMVLQALLGIAMSILLGIYFSAIGVILGMLLSVFIFTGVIKGCKIIRYIYHKPFYVHLLILLKEFVIFTFVCGICYCFYIYVLNPSSIISFLLYSIVVFVLSNFLFIIMNLKSKQMIFAKNLVKKLIRK